MQSRITWNHTTGVRPVRNVFDETGPQRIFEDVSASGGEGVGLPFCFIKHMVEGLMLEFMRMDERLQIGAQKTHCIQLIGLFAKPHPDEMDVIRHQAIHGTKQFLACGGVEKKLPELPVEFFRQPSCRTVFKGQVPVYECQPLVVIALQARQMTLMGAGVSRSRPRNEAGC